MTLDWSDAKQKFLKTPIDIRTGLPANSDDMNVSFAEATKCLADNTVLNYRHPCCCTKRLGLIDCDHCITSAGTISPLVQNLLRYMGAYAEYSVSGNVHVLCWLDDVPRDGHKDRQWDVEFYWGSRSIPITGNRVVLPDWESPHDVEPQTRKFLRLHKSRFEREWLPPASAPSPIQSSVLTAEEVLSKLFAERDGKRWADIYAGNWQEYYDSPSDADFALLMKFAFYSGKDRQMMETMFSESALSRILIRGTVQEPTKWRTPKWTNGRYRNRTLDEAIKKTNNVYTPRKKAMSAEEVYKIGRQRVHESKKRP